MQTSEKEIEICRRFRSSVQIPGPEQKVGIALSTLALKPLNALRHPPEGETCGWYIWGGEKLSQDPKFFQINARIAFTQILFAVTVVSRSCPWPPSTIGNGSSRCLV